jgi:two-component system sensor histidine kinase/response regulator
MDDYLAKPYSRRELRQVLERWLEHRLPEVEVSVADRPVVPQAVEAPERRAVIHIQLLDQMPELDPLGRRALVHRILNAYLDGSVGPVAQIEQAIAAGDAEILRRAAHSLKSSSANIGAESLAGMFKQLERLGAAGELGEAAPLWRAARSNYAQVVSEIHRLLAAG